jgi:hypothetical protein
MANPAIIVIPTCASQIQNVVTLPDVQTSLEKTATLPGTSQAKPISIQKKQFDKNLQTPDAHSLQHLKKRLNDLNDDIINFTHVYCHKTELIDPELIELDQRLDELFDSQEMNDALSTLRVKMEHDFRIEMNHCHLEIKNAKKNMCYDYKSKETVNDKEEETSSDNDDGTRDNYMYFDATDNIVSAENIRKTYKHIFSLPEYREAVESLKQKP